MKPNHRFNRQQFDARKQARAGTAKNIVDVRNVPQLRDAVIEMQVALGIRLTAPE